MHQSVVSQHRAEMNKATAIALITLLALVLDSTQAEISHSLSVTNGRLRIEIDDRPGATLAAVHYSINIPVHDVQAGQWNFDITSKTANSKVCKLWWFPFCGSKWVYEKTHDELRPGDTIYYWLYMIINGIGDQILNQQWVVPDIYSKINTRVLENTPPYQRYNGDQKWKGRNLKLVMEDTFDKTLDLSRWEHEVTLSGAGNWEFQAYTPLPQNSFTKDGALFIKPTRTADKYGESFLTSGVWDMYDFYGMCTDANAFGCHREGKFGLLNPIMSAKLKSKQAIRYGKVEIVAKMPRGDWLWPALWMLPDGYGKGGSGAYGGWPRSGEIDIMESRGNRQYGNLGVEYMGSTLHWGSDPGNNRYEMTTSHKKALTGTLADGYHTYTFYWDESEMVFQLDGDHVATFKTPSEGFFRWGNLPGDNIWAHANNAPFDKPFYLILNVAVGGTNGFFPDDVPNGTGPKPWKNSDSDGPQKFWDGRGQWLPTWIGDDAAMQVDSVRMWQLY